MKGTRLVGAGLLALALLLVALPASGASAAKLLVLSSEGTPVANGSPGVTGVSIGECGLVSNGKVVENGVSKVKLVETSASEEECPVGESISGKINETELSGAGKVKLTGTLEIAKPGPCVYDFTKFKSTFPVPGFTFIKGSTSGKLNKALSNPTKGACEKKVTTDWFANVTSEAFGEPFEDALKS
jgi:hypothetical protein